MLKVEQTDRVRVIADLASVSPRTVVFTRTKRGARHLARKLSAQGRASVDLHGNLSQNARVRNLEAFSSGEATVLVATDIAARGIHVDNVGLVIHSDPPAEHKAYVHRSGRTARAGSIGTVVTIATAQQVSEVRSLLKKAGVSAAEQNVRSGADVSLGDTVIPASTLVDDAAQPAPAGRPQSSRPANGSRGGGRNGGSRNGGGNRKNSSNNEAQRSERRRPAEERGGKRPSGQRGPGARNGAGHAAGSAGGNGNGNRRRATRPQGPSNAGGNRGNGGRQPNRRQSAHA